MGGMCPVSLVILLVFCCPAMITGFLADDSGDETLQEAFAAIAELNGQLQTVRADNDRLKQELQTAQAVISQNSDTIAKMQSRVASDFVWYGDWMLAFRATKGIGREVYEAWMDKGHHDDDPMTRATLPCGCTSVNGSLPCDRHYRSRLLDTWPSGSIDEVKLVLYENGVEKEHVTFTGTGSDYLTWFSKERVVESSWSDLTPSAGFNIFSIDGDVSVKRRFCINHVYNGCAGDTGWLMAKDQLGDTCTWGIVHDVPTFLYAPSNHQITWDGRGAREADVMAVFVKFRESADFSKMCLD